MNKKKTQNENMMGRESFFSDMMRFFLHSVMGLERDRSIFVGVGWGRDENPLRRLEIYTYLLAFNTHFNCNMTVKNYILHLQDTTEQNSVTRGTNRVCLVGT